MIERNLIECNLIDLPALPPDSARTQRPMRVIALLAGASLGFLAFGAAVPTPAHALESWEVGCAYRSLPSGNGEAQRAFNCERQKMCRQMANARGAMMMEMGCFFVEPTATAPAPAATRSRPAQQQ